MELNLVKTLILPLPIISSYSLWRVGAFSVAIIEDGELQHMSAVHPEIGGEVYRARSIRDAAVFDVNEEIEVDGETYTWDTFFQGWDQSISCPCLFFARRRDEINVRHHA
jgi:hypothetical protein